VRAPRARLGREVRDHEERDQEEDQPGVHGQVEPLRAREETTEDRHRDADEHQDLEDVLDERVQVARHARQQDEPGDQARDDELDRSDRQDDEAAEDEDVEGARVEIAEHALLRERVLERAPDPLPDAREPVVRLPREQHPDAPGAGVDERDDRNEDEEGEDGPARKSFGRERRHWHGSLTRPGGGS
jgi:hypothetical protein